MKISWNRLPPASLEAAYFTVLPQYRAVARTEVYRIVGLTFYSLLEWTRQLERLLESDDDEALTRACANEMGSLVRIMSDVIAQQTINAEDPVSCLCLLGYLSVLRFSLMYCVALHSLRCRVSRGGDRTFATAQRPH